MNASIAPRRPATSCEFCPYVLPCGGLDGNGDLFGCFHCVGRSPCPPDAACPSCNWEAFVEMGEEIGWFDFDPKTPLTPFTTGLPSYIPKQLHTSNRSRRAALGWVAVSLGSLFKLDRSRRDYLPRYQSLKSARSGLRVDSRTQIFVCSATHDAEIELFWEYHRKNDTSGRLREMGVVGATTPNYSYFTDSPRPAALRNRKRILLTAERFGEAQVPTILHLNAHTDADWRGWAEILKHQPQMAVVAKEFQTGNKDVERGRHAWDCLSELEQQVGRSLHVVAIGAAQFLPYAATRVSGITLVDSAPFMKTMMRQLCVTDRTGDISWIQHPTDLGDSLDGLLESNVRSYARWVERTLLLARPVGGANGQLPLPFEWLRAG